MYLTGIGTLLFKWGHGGLETVSDALIFHITRKLYGSPTFWFLI